jgi:hypothetical protein
MKKLILIFLLIIETLPAQTFTVEKLKGTAQAQTGLNENWVDLKEGTVINQNSTVVAGKNSIIQLKTADNKFTLNGPSALTLSDIKKMSVDDVLLALAMEDVRNAPKNNNEAKSKSTAVYGTEENGKNMPANKSTDFGVKRLNGAMQLAESGYSGSAVIAAKETYRKYPDTKNIPSYRIFFAQQLRQLGLYEESYDEFDFIKNLKLNDEEKKEVDSELNDLSKKLGAKG